MIQLGPDELAAKIDHTLLKPDAVKADIERLCNEGVENGFASVVVNSVWLPFCGGLLAPKRQPEGDLKEDSMMAGMFARPLIGLCTVVSFPLGADSITAKSFAAEDAVRKGATEIDMVIDLGHVKDGLWDEVEEEIALMRDGMDRFAMDRRPVLKAIIETPLLTDDEITMVSKRVVAGGADFVKTNSGFVGEGARPEHVKLIRETIGDTARIKASAGIRTLEQALALIEAGADRLGTSAAMDIMAEARG